MGFVSELHLLYPRHDPDAGRRVWVAHEMLHFGRVTHIDKLTEARYQHRQRTPHARAGICILSVLLAKLFAKLDGSFREVYAPTILPGYPLDDDMSDAERFDEEREQILAHVSGDVIDLEGPFNLARHIRSSELARHNRTIGMCDQELQAYARETSPILKPPFLWESCANLAAWLQEAEVTGLDEWRELQQDSRALALFRASRSYLREVGQADARALFVFPL